MYNIFLHDNFIFYFQNRSFQREICVLMTVNNITKLISACSLCFHFMSADREPLEEEEEESLLHGLDLDADVLPIKHSKTRTFSSHFINYKPFIY